MIRIAAPVAFTAILISSAVSYAAEQVPRRPNILFAFADDWGRCAGAYAASDGPGGINDVVKTPNFDRIAKTGVLFNNAFVNAPSCTPCRSSLLSGKYFWQTGRGAILQGAIWDSKIPSWPLLLKDSGYHIGKTWKVWSPGAPRDAPYGGRAHAYEKAGGRFNGFSQRATQLIAGDTEVEQAKEELLDEVRGNFAAFIADRNEKSQPFCYWFGPTNVHRRWIKGSGKRLWKIDPDSLKGKMPPFLPDVAEVREDLADYFGEIAAFDAALGVLMKELERIGERENTIVVISGDHGPPGFPHGKCNLYDFGTRVPLLITGPGVKGGRVVDDFTMLPDLAPTFLAAGSTEIPKGMTARSLWPVLKSNREGLVDATRTQVFTGRERHVRIARAGNLPYPQRAIRTADHLLVINFRPDRFPLGDPYKLNSDNPPTAQQLEQSTFVTLPDEDAGPTKAWLVGQRDNNKWKPYFDHAYGKRPREELFDLKKDPHQMKNVAKDPAYSKELSELRDRLMAELRRTEDPRLIDNGKFFETPPLAGPAVNNQKRN
ncbi:MAG: sulfatase [Pirellulaceae bacterium]|jgi:arylsulfatase A-like enzyme|nr:sulfatase [Pirellulaceae bacterium]